MDYNLLKNTRLFLLDMDGTIYHENELIPGALEFFDAVRANGEKYAFMTNNSSKSAQAYIRKLKQLHIEAEESDIVSSVSATIHYLKQHYPQNVKIYLVGTKSFEDELSVNGYEIVPADYRNDDVGLCVLGFDTELNYQKLEGLCHYISNGIDYIATNCDLRCPVKGGKFIPDCGSMAKMIELTTGKTPKFIGKPEPDIVFMASRTFGIPVDEIMCIGDRLYTDIAVGINSGARSAVVLTGETKMEDIEHSDYKPDYIFDSIRDIAVILKSK